MRALLLLASIVVLVDTSFYAAITPLLPDLTEEYGLSKTGAGVLAAAYPIGTFVGGLPGGYMAARVGVKPTVLVGLALMTGASVVFAFADSIVLLDAARFVQGVGGAASWAGAMGWIAGAAPKEQRGQMIGTAMGAGIAGALFGPVLGVAADLTSYALVFCGVGVVGVGLMVWTARTPGAQPVGDGSFRALFGALSNGEVRVGLLLVTIPGLLFGTLSVLGPLRMDELGAASAAIGATWLLAAGFEAIVSPLAGRFSDRRGRMAPLLAGLVGGTVTFAVLPWPDTALLLAIVIIVGSPVIGLLWTPAMAMLSDGADHVGLEQGLAFGLMNLTWATGQSLGDIGGSHLGEAAGDEVAYLVLSAICLLAFVILRTSSLRKPATA
ncbi:putative MFS family arabinose efflux permease [Solirubrobacter pauli]|uniref:Putative MFS family arabinose efflux permease n=1 Tax=Solirubrobacter pauli TaxID=166793 RepID=A0A660L1E5_9ACTN|nr:MFS transporter [Solirubrobacter pauli]RKQ87767.1 putative MFS family arabinose efflux permease [Solirubrobacter pauli]